MLSPLVGFFARKSPRRKNFSEVSPLLPSKGQDVELAQWFYLEGTGTVAEVTEGEGEAKRTYSKVTFTAANVVNNKGTELRPAKTFTGEEYYEIELVRDDANAVVGAWIKNPAFGDKVTETVTDEASGTTATVVTGHTGFYTMKTDADGAFAFNDDNTAGLLPYVQFDKMLTEVGICKGIENYSAVLSGRAPGSMPTTLLDYFPNDFLLFVDESHVTLPQVRAMYGGDYARKKTLVEYGFRLPSAFDNRPLKTAFKLNCFMI